MHGRKRASRDQLTQDQRNQRLEKALKFKLLVDTVLENYKKFDVEGFEQSEESRKKNMELSGMVLSKNPDIYTVWNFRKQLLSPSDLKDELSFTQTCISTNPKSYYAWNHRRFLYESLPDANLEAEIKLCDQFLQVDERNFHCWNYRKFLEADDTSELAKTEKLIEANFSNASAWNKRQKILKKSSLTDESIQKELSLIHDAVFIQPADQTAWFYARWLYTKISDASIQASEIEIIRELISLEPEAKFALLAIVQMHQLGWNVPKTEVSKCLQTLQKSDPMHILYYEVLATELES